MKNDVWVIKIYYLIGHLLGTSTSGENYSQLKTFRNRLYTFVLSGLVFFGSIYSLYNRYNGSWIESSLSQIILEFIETLLELLFMLFCMFDGFICRRIWLSIFSNFDKIDQILSPYKFEVKCSKFNYLFKFIVFNIIYTVIHASELILWKYRENITDEFGYILYRIVMFYHFFNTFTAMSITNALKYRYTFLCCLVEKTIAESEKIIIFCQETKDISIKFTKIKDIFWLLDGIVQTYNKIFGWPVFFGTIISVIVCLGNLNVITNYANIKNSFDLTVTLINALYAIIYLLSTIAIVTSCDSVEKAAKKIILACYLHSGLLDKKPMRDNIVYFAEFAEKLIPTFSAAGFFQINQNILSTLFSTIITYFIIIIQFNSAM